MSKLFETEGEAENETGKKMTSLQQVTRMSM
jgi:hypothetical protein